MTPPLQWSLMPVSLSTHPLAFYRVSNELHRIAIEKIQNDALSNQNDKQITSIAFSIRLHKLRNKPFRHSCITNSRLKLELANKMTRSTKGALSKLYLLFHAPSDRKGAGASMTTTSQQLNERRFFSLYSRTDPLTLLLLSLPLSDSSGRNGLMTSHLLTNDEGSQPTAAADIKGIFLGGTALIFNSHL